VNEHKNSSHDSNAPDDSNTNSQQGRISNPISGATNQLNANETNERPHRNPRPPVLIRMWRGLWRRSGIAKANWVEKATLGVALLLLVVSGTQAVIYYWQATLMNNSINQNERAIILNRGQLAVATRSADAAANAAKATLQQLDLQREFYRLEKGGAKLRLAAFGINHHGGDAIAYGIRLKNDGEKEGMNISMCRNLEFRKPLPDEKQCTWLPMRAEKRQPTYRNRQTAVLDSENISLPTGKNITIYIWAFFRYTDWTGAELREHFCKQIPADEIVKIQGSNWGSENPLAFPDCE
jgi:hypothetical protein